MSLSFRTRLFFALLMVILPVLAIVLFAVNHQTDLQLKAFTERSTRRAIAAFADAESSNRGRLEGLGRRFTSGARAPALVQASIYDLDTTFVRDELNYELKLAGEDSALVGFTDISGRPLAAVERHTLLADPAEAIPSTVLDSMLARGDTTGFGYQLVRGRLYSVFVGLVSVPDQVRSVDQPVGFFVVGRAIDPSMAENIAQAVEGSVCFVADNRCVVSNQALAESGLTGADMVEATHGERQRPVAHNGRRWLLLADPLTGGTGWRVIARPLDEVLQPFEDIRAVLLRIGVLALIIAPLFAIMFARTLSRPLRSLVEAVLRVAHGDFTAHVPVTSGDELGKLSAAFNEMTDGLRMKETYRGLLDKVISPEITDEMLRSDIALGGENREVTVLFADIRGFTSFSEDMEPQEVIHVLNETMERASAVVEREGGVVDKYMGDEIMALFGAPVSHANDTVRATRAAIGIRDAIAELSAERTSRGERGLTIGIGINTGIVVAGNMGSTRRLNYTVLGMAVNVAARLCAQAEPQEILLGDATYQRVKQYCDVRSAGLRALRGLTRPLPTYALLSVHSDIPAPPPAPPRIPSAVGAVVSVLATAASLLAATLAAPRSAFAQRSSLLEYASANGFTQASLGARFDVTGYAPQSAPPWLIPSTKSFLAPRASAYGELFLGPSLYGLTELRVDRGEAPAAKAMEFRVEQLFLRYSISRLLELQAGKFVTPFGSYAQRHGSVSDPFIRPPFPYEWPTMVTPGLLPESNNEFLEWRDAPEYFRTIGVPPIWGIPYQVGAMAFGIQGPVSYRLAVMNSAPSSIPAEWNSIRNVWRRPSFVANASYQISPDMHAGLSFNRGPYMREQLTQGQTYPAGETPNEFIQTLVGVDAGIARDFVELRGEFFFDDWYVPLVIDHTVDYSYYVETRLKLAPGLFAAGRFAQIRFNEITREPDSLSASFTKMAWDYPASRIEIGGGYQLTEALSLRAQYQWTIARRPRELPDNLFSIQFRFDP